MYKLHQKQISKYARQSPDNLADAMRFVILTIQQQLSSAVKQSKGEQEANLFGFKLKAVADIEANKQHIFNTCERLFETNCHDNLLQFLADQHGFGLVKAGFVCQLVYGISGCIDTHNLKLHNIPINQVTYNNKAKDPTRYKKAVAYNKLIELRGGTESLWDNWCDYVAAKNPNTYKNGFEVSELHVEAITKGALK